MLTRVAGSGFITVWKNWSGVGESAYFYFGLVADREADGTGDEAEAGGFVVQLQGYCGVGTGRDGDVRMQHDAGEMAAAAGCFDHGCIGLILIGRDDDAIDGAAVQIRQHVAGREAGEQEFLGIVAGPIAAEMGVGGAWNRGQFAGR